MLKISRKSWPSASRYIKAGKSNKKIDTINENEKAKVKKKEKVKKKKRMSK